MPPWLAPAPKVAGERATSVLNSAANGVSTASRLVFVQPNRRFFRHLLLLLAAGFILIFWFGNRGLNEPDEGRYAQIALEFLEPQADWWDPRMSDFGHYDKPPLIYWLTALSFQWFGLNEWAARAPSMLGAFLALAGLGWAAFRLRDFETAKWSVLVCATLGQFWLLARFLTPDMLLTGWCTLAIGAWAECRHRNGAWGFWLLSLVFWTLAFWTKATAALVPLFGLVTGVWILDDVAGKKALRLGILLPSMLVLGSPWYLRMLLEHPDLVSFFFRRELVGRVMGHVDGRHGPIYYYLALSLVAWLPWWPVALYWAVRRQPSMQRWMGNWWQTAWAAGWEGWIVIVGLVVFSAISSKLPTYTLPLAPWMSVLLARSLLESRAQLPPKTFRRTLIATGGLFFSGLLAVTLLIPHYESRLGVNSSLRSIAKQLIERGAQLVYLDRYWHGMEFYFGEHVRYVVLHEPRESKDDRGFDDIINDTHFCRPEQWRQTLDNDSRAGIWVVRFQRAADSPFDSLIRSSQVMEKETVGDFLLARIR
jgi:4-amino-4-deoxy-L-arabinose transferase-like glycosyltransferase